MQAEDMTFEHLKEVVDGLHGGKCKLQVRGVKCKLQVQGVKCKLQVQGVKCN